MRIGPISPSEAMQQNATDAHARWQLCVSRNYSNVILSEYRTKEITSALLGLITVCDRRKEKNRILIGSDQPGQSTGNCMSFSLYC